MSLKEIVDSYLLKHGLEIAKAKEEKDFKWLNISASIDLEHNLKTATNPEYVRSRYRYLNKTKWINWRDKSLNELEEQGKKLFNNTDSTYKKVKGKFIYTSGKEDKTTGKKEWTFTASNIPTEQEIIEYFNIDTTKWKIVNIYHKTSFGGKYSITVQTNLLKGVDAVDYKKEFEDFIKKLNISVLNRPKFEFPKHGKKDKKYCLYLPIFDAHIGKLAHKSTSGDDYDLNIAIERYKEAIQNLVNSAYSSYGFDEICLVTGSDLLHVDSKKNETTSGTPQDSDSRFEKVYEKTLALLVETIDFLSSLAPVKVIIVRGNHAEHLEYTLGVSLKWLYRGDKNITIDAEPFLRKYYKYGNTGILISHGDKEKHDNLPLIFATENKELWASTEYHQIHLGHLHTDRKKVFLTSNEYSGCQVSIFPSLSGDDYWHSGKGYNLNQKRAVAIIYDKELGEVAKLNYVI